MSCKPKPRLDWKRQLNQALDRAHKNFSNHGNEWKYQKAAIRKEIIPVFEHELSRHGVIRFTKRPKQIRFKGFRYPKAKTRT